MLNSKNFVSSLVLGFVLVFAAHGVRADMMAKNSACKSDIQKYCSAAEPGTPAMGKCMKDNMSSFSDACQTHMKTARTEMKKMHEELTSACKSDIQNFCSNVKMGGGAVMKCLKDNESQLSTGCKTARDEMHSKFKAKHAAGEAAKDASTQ